MNLLLISKTAIIIKIFTLVCKKLDLELQVQSDLDIKENRDFIIIDQDFIGDSFNSLKKSCSKLGAISNDELPFEKARDFVIPRPFLPLQLQNIIEEQIQIIKEENQHNRSISSMAGDIDTTEHVTSYVESLADNIVSDIEDDNDESIVTLASLNDGGVLDTSELSKISDILRQDGVQDEVQIDENDWKDLSDIIDDALTEVSDYNIDDDNDSPIKLILNMFTMDELRPLLEKLDQKVIDKLSNGESVDLRLCLKDYK